jgi:hypothetical protein
LLPTSKDIYRILAYASAFGIVNFVGLSYMVESCKDSPMLSWPRARPLNNITWK